MMEERIGEGFKGERAIIIPSGIRNILSSNIITKQMYITHIGYYPFAKHHFRRRINGAKQNILLYCESGKGWIEMGNKTYKLSRNKTFILPVNFSHAYGADLKDPWSIYWFHFTGTNEKMFNSIIGKIIDTSEIRDSRNAERTQLYEEMFHNLEMGYSVENLEYVSFCLMYYLASLKYGDVTKEMKVAKEPDVIQKSILFMKKNLDKKITLDDIAGSVAYSSSHFSNFFQKETSFSPIDYFNQLKIQKACSFLQFSNLKVKDIAYKLGYYDPFHFSKAFKKEIHLTPSEYREKYKP